MTQPVAVRTVGAHDTGASGSRIDYERAPLGFVIARYLTPFWLFRDATKGDRLARAAAYRHNRHMRVYLPGYMRKWALQAVLALALVFAFDSAAAGGARIDGYVVCAACAGIAFAYCLCMLVVIGYAYLYLSRHDYC
jgi:hypothetical protein